MYNNINIYIYICVCTLYYSCFVRPCARRTVCRVSFSLDSFIGQGAISMGVRKPGSPLLKRYSCVRRRTLRVRRYYYYDNSPYRIIARAFADNIIYRPSGSSVVGNICGKFVERQKLYWSVLMSVHGRRGVVRGWDGGESIRP